MKKRARIAVYKQDDGKYCVKRGKITVSKNHKKKSTAEAKAKQLRNQRK